MTIMVENKVLVYFIRNGECIVLCTEPGYQSKLVMGKDLTRRIVRRIDDHRSCGVGEEAREMFGVEVPVRRTKGHEARCPARHLDGRNIGVVGRLEYDYLVSGVDQGLNCVVNRFRCTVGYGNLVLRVEVEAHPFECGSSNGFA